MIFQSLLGKGMIDPVKKTIHPGCFNREHLGGEFVSEELKGQTGNLEALRPEAANTPRSGEQSH